MMVISFGVSEKDPSNELQFFPRRTKEVFMLLRNKAFSRSVNGDMPRIEWDWGRWK
jgi:hypothetical protein